MQVEVPEGKYCSKGGSVVCENLDTRGYGTGCGLNMGRPSEDDKGWQLKPQKCIDLIEV